jgi:hypothetical protein
MFRVLVRFIRTTHRTQFSTKCRFHYNSDVVMQFYWSVTAKISRKCSRQKYFILCYNFCLSLTNLDLLYVRIYYCVFVYLTTLCQELRLDLSSVERQDDTIIMNWNGCGWKRS